MRGCVCDVHEPESCTLALQPPSEDATQAALPGLPLLLREPLGSVQGTQDAQDSFLALPAPSSSGCDCKMPADHSLSCSPPMQSHGHSGDNPESPELGMTLQCRHTSFLIQEANLDDKIGTRSSLLPVLSSLPEIKQRTSLQAHVAGVLKDAISKHHVALLDPRQVQNSAQAKLRDSLTQTQCS